MTLAPTTPQPTKSVSNSRTNRVIEQLQDTWDTLQRDLASTKTQASKTQLILSFELFIQLTVLLFFPSWIVYEKPS
jgi:hypothetical protein